MSTLPAIARIWRGCVRAQDAGAYERYMLEVALPGYGDVTGNRGGYLMRRRVSRPEDQHELEEFCMVTVWESMEAIRAFAGDDPEVAVFYPEDERFLVTRDERVAHYTVYAQLPTP
jgi:heme-degrading monooxygenase HmoA